MHNKHTDTHCKSMQIQGPQ